MAEQGPGSTQPKNLGTCVELDGPGVRIARRRRRPDHQRRRRQVNELLTRQDAGLNTSRDLTGRRAIIFVDVRLKAPVCARLWPAASPDDARRFLALVP
jgi:hypothetical protein